MGYNKENLYQILLHANTNGYHKKHSPKDFCFTLQKLTKICCVGINYSAICRHYSISKYSCYDKID
ncbi:hypothetical protein HpMMM14_15120 [Helicobacter pylori]